MVPLVVFAGRSLGSFGGEPLLVPLLCRPLWSSRCCPASSARKWARLRLRSLVGGALPASTRDVLSAVARLRVNLPPFLW